MLQFCSISGRPALVRSEPSDNYQRTRTGRSTSAVLSRMSALSASDCCVRRDVLQVTTTWPKKVQASYSYNNKKQQSKQTNKQNKTKRGKEKKKKRKEKKKRNMKQVEAEKKKKKKKERKKERKKLRDRLTVGQM